MDPILELRQLCPEPSDLLDLEVEELAGLLLHAIQRSGHNKVSRYNFVLALRGTPQPFPGVPIQPLEQAMSEAWAWLEVALLVVPAGNDANWSVLSRKGREVASPPAFKMFREAAAFPRALLHPVIEKEAWPSFIRGKFDTAIFEAYKEIEIAVREAGQFEARMVGTDLMRAAFNPDKGPLTNASLPSAEREALSALFAGAIGSYKNPVSHRRVGRVDASEAGEILVLASHLLRIVDDRKASA